MKCHCSIIFQFSSEHKICIDFTLLIGYQTLVHAGCISSRFLDFESAFIWGRVYFFMENLHTLTLLYHSFFVVPTTCAFWRSFITYNELYQFSLLESDNFGFFYESGCVCGFARSLRLCFCKVMKKWFSLMFKVVNRCLIASKNLFCLLF